MCVCVCVGITFPPAPGFAAAETKVDDANIATNSFPSRMRPISTTSPPHLPPNSILKLTRWHVRRHVYMNHPNRTSNHRQPHHVATHSENKPTQITLEALPNLKSLLTMREYPKTVRPLRTMSTTATNIFTHSGISESNIPFRPFGSVSTTLHTFSAAHTHTHTRNRTHTHTHARHVIKI